MKDLYYGCVMVDVYILRKIKFMKDLYYGCVMVDVYIRNINKIHERPLLWMCHGRCIHTKINKIHE